MIHSPETLSATGQYRQVQHPDGSVEIVRTLEAAGPRRQSPSHPLAFERSILWLQPITELDYVRSALVRHAQTRRGPLLVKGVGMVVGYSRLNADAPRNLHTGGYTRRLFYLTEEDLVRNLNQIPPGVLDPRSIIPGFAGEVPQPQEPDRGYPAWIGTGV